MTEAPKPFLGLGKDFSPEALDHIAMTLMTELYRRNHDQEPPPEVTQSWPDEIAASTGGSLPMVGCLRERHDERGSGHA